MYSVELWKIVITLLRQGYGRAGILHQVVPVILNPLSKPYSGNMNKDDLQLKSNPTLRDLQDYVAKMVKLRGFDKETLPEVFMLFLEECGEMAKAARKTQNIKSDHNSEHFDLEHEIADVFIYLLDICNYCDIDLEESFRGKEEINKKRLWK